MNYEDYKGSEQEKEEDRVFMEFNRRHGITNPYDNLRVAERLIVIACIAAIVSMIAWVALF